MSQDKKLTNIIARFVRQHTGRVAVHDAGGYRGMAEGKTVCEWGWDPDTVHAGQKIAVSQPSPARRGDTPIAFFDYEPFNGGKESYA